MAAMANVRKAGENGKKPFWIRLLSRPFQFSLDLTVLVVAFSVAYLLRFEFEIPDDYLVNASVQLPLIILIQFSALFIAGVYDFIWRYVGLGEIKAFAKAAFWSFVPVVAIRLFLPVELQSWRMPLSIIVVDTVMAFGGVLGLRVVRRALYERYERGVDHAESLPRGHSDRVTEPGPKKNVLLIGAGRAGVLAAREILNRRDMQISVKGFLDDDPTKHGAVVGGIKVLGGSDRLPQLVKDLGIDHVIITIAHASRKDIGNIVKQCERIPVRARIIPGLHEILDGQVNLNRLRDVEIEDLLGREAVKLEEDEVRRFLSGKVVMVTGAGGSIGSELARQVARLEPSRLLLVERAEFVLFDIDRNIRELWPELEVVPLVADVGDEPRMRAIFEAYKPQVVFHAAAHKHVPMMESNPTEAIKNNVFATRVVGQIAGESGAEAFVFISTDKAVNPTSVMGASKRVAELVVQCLEDKYPTRYVAVRFGNVLGSTGSVIPLFREQIRKGGPLTVTDPEMIRYFMTIPEAAQLVLQAGAMGEGGEIFVLDMGEPVRILDLAKDMITLSGLRPFEDVDIVFTGSRPGEKMFEELQTDGEQVAKTKHPKILIGKIAAYPEMKVADAVHRLVELSQDGREKELRDFLNAFLPEARLSVPAIGKD